FAEPTLAGIPRRPIEGMRHRAAQPIAGTSREPRVGVERDDVAHVGGRDGGRGQKARIGRPAEKAIELVKLAALALPSHPRPLARVPEPPTVEEKEALAATWRGAVAPVQPRDTVPRRRQRLVIARQGR